MSKLEKFGLLFMLLGVSSFRDGGWTGGVGVLLLFFGWAMFTFPVESAPNKVLQSDGGEVLPAHKHLYIDGRCACGASINRRR